MSFSPPGGVAQYVALQHADAPWWSVGGAQLRREARYQNSLPSSFQRVGWPSGVSATPAREASDCCPKVNIFLWQEKRISGEYWTDLALPDWRLTTALSSFNYLDTENIWNVESQVRSAVHAPQCLTFPVTLLVVTWVYLLLEFVFLTLLELPHWIRRGPCNTCSYSDRDGTIWYRYFIPCWLGLASK